MEIFTEGNEVRGRDFLWISLSLFVLYFESVYHLFFILSLKFIVSYPLAFRFYVYSTFTITFELDYPDFSRITTKFILHHTVYFSTLLAISSLSLIISHSVPFYPSPSTFELSLLLFVSMITSPFSLRIHLILVLHFISLLLLFHFSFHYSESGKRLQKAYAMQLIRDLTPSILTDPNYSAEKFVNLTSVISQSSAIP